MTEPAPSTTPITWREPVIDLLCAITRRAPILFLDKLADALRDPHRQSPDRVIRWRGSGKLSLNWGHEVEWDIYKHGVFEPNVYAAMRQFVPVGGYVIDAGANIGLHTLALSQLVGETGEILAIEPNPRVRERLQHNVLQSRVYGNITISEVAVMAEKTDALTAFYVPAAQIVSGKARLTATPGRDWETLNVPTETLDHLVETLGWRRVDFIKIDIEGADLAALHGARGILTQHQPKVILKYAPDSWQAAGYSYADLYAFLREIGYSLWWLPAYRFRGISRPGAVRIGAEFNLTPYLERGIRKFDLLARRLP